MARHRFDEMDDRKRWGGPALLEVREGTSCHDARRDKKPGAEQPGEKELLLPGG